ncbi:MAG: Carbohydrate-selective porin OprB [Caulobacteraceae bacterium]|nr:Carbohydrate-selective porin OprB [Caulobacteraceae bacterium]
MAEVTPLAAAVNSADDKAPLVTMSLRFTDDALAVVSGGVNPGASDLRFAIVTADFDLDRAFGWKGASAHIDAMSNSGRLPSARAGSILGVDGNEVDGNRTRLPQAWIQKSFASDRLTVLGGFYDLGADLNIADSSHLLVGRASGVSEELNASGSAGPAAFPITALAVRGRFEPTPATYGEVVVANAHAATMGDHGGPDFKFHDGVLIAAEAGYRAEGFKFAAGAWGYTRRRPDLLDVAETGEPLKSASHGAYIIAERPLNSPANGIRLVTGFIKTGLSDGDTTPFDGSLHAGVLVEHLFASRAESTFSIGIAKGWLTRKYREEGAEEGRKLGPSETDLEITYSDLIAPHVTMQPDFQWIHTPSGDTAIKDAIIVGLRLNIAY